MLISCKWIHTSRSQICFLDRMGASRSSSSNYREMLNKAFCTDCSQQQNQSSGGKTQRCGCTWQALQLRPGSVQDTLTSSLGIFIKMTFPFLKVHSSTHIWQRTAVWTAFTSSQCICYASNDIMHSSVCQSSASTVQTTKTEPPESPWGKWTDFPPQGFSPCKTVFNALLVAVFSPTHTHFISHLCFLIIPNLHLLYPVCKHFLFAEGRNFCERNMLFLLLTGCF